MFSSVWLGPQCLCSSPARPPREVGSLSFVAVARRRPRRPVSLWRLLRRPSLGGVLLLCLCARRRGPQVTQSNALHCERHDTLLRAFLLYFRGCTVKGHSLIAIGARHERTRTEEGALATSWCDPRRASPRSLHRFRPENSNTKHAATLQHTCNPVSLRG